MSNARTVIAVDAMGGDRAPGEIVAGALQAVEQSGVAVLLVGRVSDIEPQLPGGACPDGVEVLHAEDVIGMDDEPLASVRKHKDASITRAIEAVRDGRAAGMVSAGNTGAVTTAAALRLGRFEGVPSPAIAVPIPVPGSHPQVLIDSGAVVDPVPERLAQYALMGCEYARARYEIAAPKVGLLSNGEEPGKGDALRKAAYPLLEAVPGFVGNVEGSDLMHAGTVDVFVTDGFTGNIALKSLEGAIRSLAAVVFGVLDSSPEAREAAKTIMPTLLEAAVAFDPDETGGAVLAGVNGVTVISHGSSSARAIVRAIEVAAECADRDVVGRMRAAVADAG